MRTEGFWSGGWRRSEVEEVSRSKIEEVKEVKEVEKRSSE